MEEQQLRLLRLSTRSSSKKKSSHDDDDDDNAHDDNNNSSSLLRRQVQKKDSFGIGYGTSERAKAGRSSVLGGSASFGNFQICTNTTTSQQYQQLGLPKSYSVHADGSPSYLTPIQLGRQELYEMVPFLSVMGLQKRERSVSEAFAHYAAELDIGSVTGLTDEQKQTRSSRATMILMDELELESNVVTTPLIFAIIVATGSQFLVGYNTGVMNTPEKVVFPGHSTGLWSLAVAAFAIGGPFGAIVGGRMADLRGRRGALMIDTWTFLAGGLLQTCAPDMYTIIVSRFIIGFASGYSSVLVPIYLGELAPPTLRGMLGTLTQFAMVIGILVADLGGFVFATIDGWRALFSITAIVAVIQLLCSPFLLESPRWLLTRDPQSLRARYIIKKLRGLRYDHEVENELGNYIIGEAAQHQDSKLSITAILFEMISHRKIRMLLISSLLLQMAQQLCGINAVFYYSTSFFEGVIDNPLVGTTIVGVVNVLATYVALLLMDSCGRRSLILWSSGGMFLSCLVIVTSLLGYLDNMFALIAVTTYVSFFEIGLGPIPWLIVAEMFEGKYVAVAMSLCCQVNWACNFIIGLIFPYLKVHLGSYSFLPFAVILALTFLFALFILPETQGTTPEELMAEMTRRNSKSVIYQANTEKTAELDGEWRDAMKQLIEEEQQQMADGTFDYGFHTSIEGGESGRYDGKNLWGESER